MASRHQLSPAEPRARCDGGCTTEYILNGGTVTSGATPDHTAPSNVDCETFTQTTQAGYTFRYKAGAKWCNYENSAPTDAELFVMQSIDLNELPRKDELGMCTDCSGTSDTVCGQVKHGVLRRHRLLRLTQARHVVLAH